MTSSRRREAAGRQRGQTLMIYALAMALMLFGMFCMVVDVSVIYAQAARVQSAAQDAALSGANVVAPCSLFHNTKPQLDIGQCPGSEVNARPFDTVCRHAGDLSAGILVPVTGSGTSCVNTGGSNIVTATVAKVVPLPLTLFGVSATVRGTAQAQAVAGTNQPDCVLTNTCP